MYVCIFQNACEKMHIPSHDLSAKWGGKIAAFPFSCQVIIEKTDRQSDVLGQTECGSTLPRKQGGPCIPRMPTAAFLPLLSLPA